MRESLFQLSRFLLLLLVADIWPNDLFFSLYIANSAGFRADGCLMVETTPGGLPRESHFHTIVPHARAKTIYPKLCLISHVPQRLLSSKNTLSSFSLSSMNLIEFN